MRLFLALLAILLFFLPTLEGTNNDDNDSTKNAHYILTRTKLREQPTNEKNLNEKNKPLPRTRNKKLKALQREQKLEEQRELLFSLKQQLKNEGIRTEFLDKFLKEGSKARAKIFHRLIKKAKKKIAKSVEKKNKRKRRRRGNKGVKEVKEVNLFSGKSIPSIKSLTGANSRSRVRGPLNPCPLGQTRIRGRCRCPYLSSWDSEQNKCECIYGTYRDSSGNCVTHF